MGKSKIIRIIADRDDIDIMTAEEMVDEAIDMINDAIAEERYMEVDDILMNQLGLEPDYLFDLVNI